MSDFLSKLSIIGARVAECKASNLAEEGTKHGLILPFLNILGYDIFDHTEVVPEYTADFGIKNGEKVDYAICNQGKPVMIIEAKSCNTKLNDKHLSQLFRYFSVSQAKYGILTNGVEYWLYTDINEVNIMDREPFYTFNIAELTEYDAEQIKLMRKECFNKDNLRGMAISMKYRETILNYLKQQSVKPSKKFIKTVLEESGVGSDIGINESSLLVASAMAHFVNGDQESVDNSSECIADTKNNIAKKSTIKTVDNTEKKVPKDYEDIDLSKEYDLWSVNTSGHKIDYATILGKTFEKIGYYGLMVELLDIIYEKNKKTFEMLVDDTDFEGGKIDRITRDPSRCRVPKKLKSCDVYVEASASSKEHVEMVKSIIDKCKFEKDAVMIKFYA